MGHWGFSMFNQWPHGRGGSRGIALILACQKILLLTKNYLPKIQNMRLKIPHCGGI